MLCQMANVESISNPDILLTIRERLPPSPPSPIEAASTAASVPPAVPFWGAGQFNSSLVMYCDKAGERTGFPP